MKSEDTVADPLMSVQFYIKSKIFFILCLSYLLISFLLQETLKSVSLPLYGYLKQKNNTNNLKTSEDTVEDPLTSVNFYIKQEFLHFVLQSIYRFHFYCKTRLNLCFYHAMDL